MERVRVSLRFLLCGIIAAISARNLLQESGDDFIPPVKVSYRGYSKVSSQAESDFVEAEVQVSLKGGVSEYRVPIALTIILDGSESQLIDGTVERIKETLNYIADNLRDADFIGFTIYDLQSRDELSLSKFGVGNIADNFSRAISSYNPMGSTNLFQGLQFGLNQQSRLDVTGQIIQAILLFSDGFANTGKVENQQLVDLIGAAAKEQDEDRPLATYVIAAGFEFDDQLLEEIADVNNGAFYTVSNTEEIQRAYGLIFGTLITTYYNNVQVEFEPKSGVVVDKVESGSVLQEVTKVSFPDLESQKRKDITYSFKIPAEQALQDGDNLSVGKVSVSYVNQGKLTGAKFQQSFDLNILNTSQSADYKDPIIEIQKLQQQIGSTTQAVRLDLQQNDFASASQQLEETNELLEEIKTGGLLDQLQNTSDFFLVETVSTATTGSRRKMLQDLDDVENQIEYYNRLFEYLECVLLNARNALSELRQTPDSIEVKKRTFSVINGISNTLILQRVQLLPDLNCSTLDLFANDAQIRGYNQQPQVLQDLPIIPYIDNSGTLSIQVPQEITSEIVELAEVAPVYVPSDYVTPEVSPTELSPLPPIVSPTPSPSPSPSPLPSPFADIPSNQITLPPPSPPTPSPSPSPPPSPSPSPPTLFPSPFPPPPFPSPSPPPLFPSPSPPPPSLSPSPPPLPFPSPPPPLPNSPPPPSPPNPAPPGFPPPPPPPVPPFAHGTSSAPQEQTQAVPTSLIGDGKDEGTSTPDGASASSNPVQGRDASDNNASNQVYVRTPANAQAIAANATQLDQTSLSVSRDNAFTPFLFQPLPDSLQFITQQNVFNDIPDFSSTFYGFNFP